jgi:uncharacterized membrane protein YgcG
MLLALALLVAAPTNYPAYTDYVVDAANVLDAGAQEHLKKVASKLDHDGVAQVAVLTITDQMLGDDSIDDYAVGVFTKWNLGHDKKRSDGVLIVYKPGKQGNRLSRVKVGYGVEGVLPDGKVGAFLDQYSSPLVRQDNYSQAAVQLVDAIANVLNSDAAAGGDLAPTAGGRRGGTGQGMRGNAPPTSFGGLAVTILCMLALVITLATSGTRRQFPGKKTQLAAAGLTGVSLVSLFMAASGAGFIALVIGLIIVAVVWASIRAHKCPKDGSWMTIDEEVIDEPTYWSDGVAHVSQRCTSSRCGYRNDYNKRIPRKQMTVVTGGGGGGGGGFGGGGGGDGFSGGGGGETGGGGAGRSD